VIHEVDCTPTEAAPPQQVIHIPYFSASTNLTPYDLFTTSPAACKIPDATSFTIGGTDINSLNWATFNLNSDPTVTIDPTSPEI